MRRSELDASALDAALDLRRALPTSSRVDILERARDALAHAREHHGTDTERVCVETLAPALRGALVPTLLLSGELGGELGEAIVAVLEEALAAMTSAHFLGECCTLLLQRADETLRAHGAACGVPALLSLLALLLHGGAPAVVANGIAERGGLLAAVLVGIDGGGSATRTPGARPYASRQGPVPK